MENPNTNVEMYGKFTWTITNFSTLDSEELYSDAFSLDGHIWRILIIQKGDLSIFLDAGVATIPHGWEKFANFRLILINQLNHKRNIIKDCSHTFNSKQGKWGFPSSISLGELWHSSRGFIVNDTCVIEAHILVHILEHKKLVAESVRNIDNKLVESIENISPKEMISTSSFGEVVDFRDIGKVEKDFIPLLEEVCSQYPLLMDIKKKRSQRFTQWAFTALGRVLHFLNFKKVIDIDDDVCNHLQSLWEELETCGFDLSWLKPSVERVFEVKRLKENVAILDMEAKILRTKIIEAKINLETKRRQLGKEKGCDLDTLLEYDDGEKDLVRRMSYQEMLEAAFQMNNQAAVLTLSVTETAAEGRFEQLKEKMDKALQVNLELNAKLHEMTIAQADCEKKQEDKATRLSETRVTEKRAIEARRKLRKDNDDLSLKCQNMKKVIEELVAQNTELIQEKVKLVDERDAFYAEVDYLNYQLRLLLHDSDENNV